MVKKHRTSGPAKPKRGRRGIPASKVLELYSIEKLTEVVPIKVTMTMATYLRRRNASKWVREAILMRLRE